MQRPVRQMVVVIAAGLLMPLFASHAQPTSGDAAINNAISDAVREGSSQFSPTPSRPQTRDEECNMLAEQIGETPRRSYRPSDRPVENSQGNDVQTVERDRTRRQLQSVYRQKCTTQ